MGADTKTLRGGGALEGGDLRLLEHCGDCLATLDANFIPGDAANARKVQVSGQVQEKCMCRKGACYWALTSIRGSVVVWRTQAR